MANHKDLDVWKKAIGLVKDVYEVTNGFPADERFGITQQIRRAAVSVPSNIAEGSGRSGDKELLKYLYIALGSLAELETQFIISLELKFCGNKEILEKIEEVRKMAIGLIKYMKSKKIEKANYETL